MDSSKAILGHYRKRKRPTVGKNRINKRPKIEADSKVAIVDTAARVPEPGYCERKLAEPSLSLADKCVKENHQDRVWDCCCDVMLCKHCIVPHMLHECDWTDMMMADVMGDDF